jgi:hypothetical protein
MAWHEAEQIITPSIHRKWNTKINTMFLYTMQNYKCYACCVFLTRNIRPSGAFWPEMTSSNWVTWPHRGSLGSCAISALVGPFHRKWRHQTSPVGLPLELEVTWPEVPLGCSLGRPKLADITCKKKSGPLPVTLLPVTSLPVAPHSSTSRNLTWTVLIYYWDLSFY